MLGLSASLLLAAAPCSIRPGSTGQGPPPAAPWTVEQMAADLDQLAAAVREEWSYYEDRTANFGLKLDALITGAKGRLDGVGAAADFKDVLDRFVAELRDGHGSAIVPGGWSGFRRLPVQLALCGAGEVVVAEVAPAEVAGDAGGVRPARGDRLVSVEGTAAASMLDHARRRAQSSTDSGRDHRALELMTQTDAAAVRMVWRTADGEEAEAELATVAAQTPIGEPEENWSISWPREGVALLRITQFSIDDWGRWASAKVEERDDVLRETRETIDAAFAELARAGAKALILDLRGNGGGTDLLGIHVAKHLLVEPFVYMKLSAKVDGRWTPPYGYTYTTDPHMARFGGPVVAMIDGGCFSTTDNFLRCLDDLHPRFTTVGRPTGGGTGAPRPIATLTHTQAQVILCTMRVHGPKSGLIEGRGTTPDVPVAWTCEDRAGGADPDLEAALGAVDAMLLRGRSMPPP